MLKSIASRSANSADDTSHNLLPFQYLSLGTDLLEACGWINWQWQLDAVYRCSCCRISTSEFSMFWSSDFKQALARLQASVPLPFLESCHWSGYRAFFLHPIAQWYLVTWVMLSSLLKYKDPSNHLHQLHTWPIMTLHSNQCWRKQPCLQTSRPVSCLTKSWSHLLFGNGTYAFKLDRGGKEKMHLPIQGQDAGMPPSWGCSSISNFSHVVHQSSRQMWARGCKLTRFRNYAPDLMADGFWYWKQIQALILIAAGGGISPVVQLWHPLLSSQTWSLRCR